ncbi:MAG: LpxL/LpxP family Kdo(2)-lipid IV(A) lauroyl/palmitoleoyl acyltransferase, partial [Gammaproteobacteria bacterium]
MLNRRLLAPRYWPSWALAGLLRLISHLPWSWQLATGRLVGRAARRIAGRRRKIAASNLALCFPEIPEDARQRLLIEHFESLGIGIIEAANGWWKPTPWLARRLHLEGLENLRNALAAGHGALLRTAHFTTREMGAQILVFTHPSPR